MKESPLYQEILEEGREEAHRADILETLRARFGKRSAEILSAKLQLAHNADDLSELFHKALHCRTLGGFRKLLSQKVKAQTAH